MWRKMYVPFLIVQLSLVVSADSGNAQQGIIGLSIAYLLVIGLIVWHLFSLSRRLHSIQISMLNVYDYESE